MVDAALLGAFLAVVAAVGWATQYVFVRLATDEGSTADAVLVAMACNAALILPPAVVLYGFAPLTPLATAVFVAAGIAGSLFGRLCQFASIEAIGASRSAPVISSTALFAAALAIAFLGERLTLPHLVGILLVVVGVAYISWETANDPDDPRPLREVGASLALPLLAAFFFGLEPILVSYGLSIGAPLLPGLGVNALAALVGFLAYRRWRRTVPGWTDLRGPSFRWYVAAGVASTLALLAYFGALELAPVVVVVPIVQVAPLVVLVLTWFFLPRRLERVTWRLATAAAVVVCGAIVVSLSG